MAVFADGHPRPLPRLSRDVARALLTRNGREPIDVDRLPGIRQPTTRKSQIFIKLDRVGLLLVSLARKLDLVRRRGRVPSSKAFYPQT